MRKVDWKIVPEDNIHLILMTVQDVIPSAKMFMADFKDSFALAFRNSGHYIGLSNSDGLQLGVKPKMVDGIWIITLDDQVKFSSIPLTPDLIYLKQIQ